jgi:WD40 repeat protein/serine/threonine protein kinase
MQDASPEMMSLFCAVLELSSTEKRAAYLADACGQDKELRDRIEALLRAHEQADGFLEEKSEAVDPRTTVDEVLIREHPGTVIGPYKLLEQIGDGGFGVVFLAEQQQPMRRNVALKLIKAGMDTRQVIARFEAEQQALALMDHPNIAKVLDAGQTSSGRPYFVMELVKGVPITEFCDQSQFTLQKRLELFVSVCQAIQHAHQKAIIHRDIKPSNVLVTLHDGTPVPKVIDFGVAKALGQQLTDKTLHTGCAQLIGTPLYMSPEQVALSHVDVDTRSDIYSLGVLLYELLTGTTPFDKEQLRDAGYDELRRIIREDEPAKPSTRISTLVGCVQRTRSTPPAGDTAPTPGALHAPCDVATIAKQRKSEPQRLSQLFRAELDWIVMKALAKDRNRRYETANGLAMDVQRYLHDEPVLACPPSVGYRLRKFGRKNGKLLTTAAAFAVLLITVAVGAALFAWSTDRQLQETRKAQDQTKRELYRSLVAEERANRLSRRVGRRLRSLEILAEATRLARELQLPEDDFLELRNETIACLALVDLCVAKTWEGCPARTFVVDFDADLERYVRFDHQHGVASVRRVADDSKVCQVRELGQFTDVPSLGLSPGGGFLCLNGGPILKVWRVTNGGAELLLQEQGHTLRFSPDSHRLATVRVDGVIHVYELPSGKQLKEWQTGPSAGTLAFHPAGRQLAIRHPGRITVFNVDTGTKLAEFRHPGEWCLDALEWHPDGKQLAAVGDDRCIYVWEASTGKLVHRLTGHTESGIGLTFNPAGDLIASNSWEWTLHLWDARTGRELFKTTWNGRAFRFSRNGRLLAADVTGHQVRLWEVIPAYAYRSLVREPHLGEGRYGSLAVSGKQPLLAVGMRDGVGLWELPGGRPLSFLPLVQEHGVAFEPSGALLTYGRTGQMRWPVEAVGPPGTLGIGPPRPLPLTTSRGPVATSRDGRVMASTQFGGAQVWHADTSDPLILLGPQHDVRWIAVSPNGRWVATGSHWATDVYVKVWDAGTGRRVADVPVEGGSRVGFSPDDRWLLTTGGGGCRLWQVETWRGGPRIGGGAFAFSPDGKILAVETGTGAVRLVDPDTGREYARLEDPDQDRAGDLTFSTDGSQLLVSTHDSPAVHVWDLRAIRAELTQRGLDWDLPLYPPAGDPPKTPPLQVTVDLGHLSPGRKQALELNNQAWPLATNSEAKLRDPARAVELAQKAVELCPTQAMCWNTLGVAHYRAGHWKNAIEALTKSMELQKGKLESFDTFFLAMAHWQLDEREKARQWYDRAVLWMEKNKHQWEGKKQWPEELRRFRSEAAALLGIEAPSAELDKKMPPPKDAQEKSPSPRHKAAGAPKIPSDPQVQKLIDQLGSDKFAEREAASRRLEALGESAFLALRQAAASSPDPEIRRRAERVAEAIARRCFGEVRRFEGSGNGISSVAFSPNGRLVVSGGGDPDGNDPTIRLWDVKTGKEVRRLEGHTAKVWYVAFSPADPKRVLSCSEDKTVRLWNSETGEELKRLEGHGRGVLAAVFSADGKRALSCGWDKTVRLWDLESGKELKRLEGHTDTVRAVSISRDGRLALSGSFDKSVRLWDLKSGQTLRTLTGHTDMVHGVAFLPDGRRAVSCAFDKTIRLWDLDSGKESKAIQAHTMAIHGLVLSRDGRRLLTASWDGTAKLWDVETGTEWHSFTEHADRVHSVAFSPDGRHALSGSSDKTVRLWRLPKPEQDPEKSPPTRQNQKDANGS